MPLENAVARKAVPHVSVTDVNIGALPGGLAGLTVEEQGNHLLHKTVFNFDGMPLTLLDTPQGGGVKIYDLPVGVVNVLGAVAKDIQILNPSDPTTTLNANASAGRFGVGTTTQANATLATTEQNIIPVSTFTPAAQNVKSAAVDAHLAAAAIFDGAGTALDLFFNVSVPTATDIDADVLVRVYGRLEFIWLLLGTKA